MKKEIHLSPRLTSMMALLTSVQLIDTDQMGAAIFSENGSPSKRASEYLKELEAYKLVEGNRRSLDTAKVWRLTKKGRDRMGVTRTPAPLLGFKVDHHLAITQAYIELRATGKLRRFVAELREPFGGGKTFSPDAFFTFDHGIGQKPFVLEVQRTPITGTRWAEKWANYSAFFDGNFHHKASFQYWPGRLIRPRIVVVSSQSPEVIQGGSRLELIIKNNLVNWTL